MEAAVALILLSLFGQQADSVMDVTAPAPYRIYIAGIQQVGGGKDFLKAPFPLAAWAGLPVSGQPPSGIEWHAEAMDFLAEHEGLKAHLGRDRVHHIHTGQQGERRIIFRNDLYAVPGGIVTKIAAFFSCNDIRMCFYPDMGKRVCSQDFFQHGLKRGLVCTAQCDAGVAHSLVENQYTRSRRCLPQTLRRIGSVAVLAQIMPNDVPHGAPGGIHQLRRFPPGSIEKVLQVGRLSGVIVNARMVHDQREWLRPLAAQVKGAQEAVLKRNVREIIPGGVATGLVRCGLVAPANNAGGIVVRGYQKNIQIGNIAQFSGKSGFHTSQIFFVLKALQGYRRGSKRTLCAG